jgi:hypothetical protein
MDKVHNLSESERYTITKTLTFLRVLIYLIHFPFSEIYYK